MVSPHTSSVFLTQPGVTFLGMSVQKQRSVPHCSALLKQGLEIVMGHRTRWRNAHPFQKKKKKQKRQYAWVFLSVGKV